MGCIDTIAHDRFPAQDQDNLGREVRVSFHYDTAHTIRGRIIRCDTEEPGEMLIMLEPEGRVVRAVECQYSYAAPRERGSNAAT